MDFVNNATYIMLLVSIVTIMVFNLLYSYRVRKLNNNLGIKTQGVIKIIVEVNVLLAIFGLTIISILWGKSLI